MEQDVLFNVSGKTIVITGGLGNLGQIFANALRDRGAKVAILDIASHEEKIESEFVVLNTDITSREQVDHAYTKLKQLVGEPYGLINNAGIDSPPDASSTENGPFEDVLIDTIARVFQVNTMGAIICSQVFGGAMARGNGGSIVNIGSIYSEVSPDQRIYEFRRKCGEEFYKPTAYGASKAALDNLTKYTATYWADKNVRVNTLCFAGFHKNQPEEFLKGYEPKVPLGRMARMEEAVGPMIFLLSDASSYMTGAKLIIDGGFTSW
jgi:NAD(P)-dependent dehydrogenase (short-subunit alcohol dehydrogenase family)